MPNTIAHFAINGLFTRTVINHADFKWIYLGCVIPDLPWILQRIAKMLPLSIDLYDLRAFCVVQSSLLLCAIISIAFAMLAKQRSKVFIILIIGCILHLLLDATQIKWANGVQLLAPINWNLLSFDYFWPESIGTYVLVTAGIIYFIFNIKKSVQPNCDEFTFTKKSLTLSGVLFLAWMALPIAFIQSVYTADNHFIATLKDTQDRYSKYIELDRNMFVEAYDGHKIITSYGEWISVKNIDAKSGALISLQGKFTGDDIIDVDTYHVHSRFRDYASMIGLVCVLGVWLVFSIRCCVIKYGRR